MGRLGHCSRRPGLGIRPHPEYRIWTKVLTVRCLLAHVEHPGAREVRLVAGEAQRDGARMTITFDHSEGLKPAAGDLKGFAVAGSDQKFVWAEAQIEDGKVMVWSDKVAEPVSVRYGWASNPLCNLVNAAGLPASPFRTDDWK